MLYTREKGLKETTTVQTDPFYTPVVLCDCGRPGLFLHDNFSSVYQIFTKLAWPHDSPVEGEAPYLFWSH